MSVATWQGPETGESRELNEIFQADDSHGRKPLNIFANRYSSDLFWCYAVWLSLKYKSDFILISEEIGVFLIITANRAIFLWFMTTHTKVLNQKDRTTSHICCVSKGCWIGKLIEDFLGLSKKMHAHLGQRAPLFYSLLWNFFIPVQLTFLVGYDPCHMNWTIIH